MQLSGEISAGLKWEAISGQQLVIQGILLQTESFCVKHKFRCNYLLVHLHKGNTLVFIERFSQRISRYIKLITKPHLKLIPMRTASAFREQNLEFFGDRMRGFTKFISIKHIAAHSD